MKCITVNELYELTKKQIDMGNGDKEILISQDDEGNGYHGLYYQYTSDPTEIKGLFDLCWVDNFDPNGVVILG